MLMTHEHDYLSEMSVYPTRMNPACHVILFYVTIVRLSASSDGT